MLKLTLEYRNFDGVRTTEDLYFNISMKALVEKEIRSNGSWFESLKAISDADGKTTDDGNVIMDRFHEIIALAYGVRSEDGVYFRQSAQRFEDFEATAAFDAFFMKVCTDADYAQKFINAVLPVELIEAAKKQMQQNAELAAKQNAEAAAKATPVFPPPQDAPVVWPPAEL